MLQCLQINTLKLKSIFQVYVNRSHIIVLQKCCVFLLDLLKVTLKDLLRVFAVAERDCFEIFVHGLFYGLHDVGEFFGLVAFAEEEEVDLVAVLVEIK